MTIVDELTPTHYRPIRLVIEIRPDEILTMDSLSLHTDIRILNAAGRELGNDHPQPQATPSQLNAFLAWVLDNLQTYENNVGLTRYTGGTQ